MSGAFLKGFFVDGPRDTAHAIRKHPIRFSLALGAFVGAAMLLDAFGVGIPLHVAGYSGTLGAHEGLVGLSAAFAAVEMMPHLKAARRSRGVARARHMGRLMWAPALVVGSAVAGGAIGDRVRAAAPASSASLFSGLRAALTRASGHLVTTADAPTILVTANDH